MMEYSDSYCRTFWRGITRKAVLYTEMVNCNAIIHAGAEQLLPFNRCEQPLALQLGGNQPNLMARCAAIAEQWGYNEVNINVGCPSNRVQAGTFGACLMADAPLVAACVQAMQASSSLPITVKHRLGINNHDSYDFLQGFVETVAAAGCRVFIVHARKAVLSGLSPKQNREVPPLIYERVYRLKQDYPELEIILNGGISSLDEAEQHLQQVDGVMVGRAAYHQPWHLADVDRRFYNSNNPGNSRAEVIAGFMPYWEQLCADGVPLSHVSRHIIGLYHGCVGSRQFRRRLSESCQHGSTDINLIKQALSEVEALQ